MRADRPVGTVLLACPMLWALWLAGEGQPTARITLIFLLGAFVMRSAGCVVNDFADRHIDLKVKRTKDRPLTAGRIGIKGSIGVFVGLIICALMLLALLPGRAVLPAVLAFLLSCVYPFTKRFFVIPQLILGLAFSMAVIMAYIVVIGTVPLSGWLVFWASTLWAVIYDTFYAMVDRDDDEYLGVHSSALWFGSKDVFVNALFAVVFMLLLVAVGLLEQLSQYYYLALVLSSLCFIYQFAIARTRQREACFIAFLNNQWVGVIVFLGIVLSYLP